jgi:hypothetical protein
VEIVAAFHSHTGHVYIHSSQIRDGYLQTLQALGVPETEALRRLDEVIQDAIRESSPHESP